MFEQLTLNLATPDRGLIQLWTAEEIFERLTAENINVFVEDKRVDWKGPNVSERTLSEYLSMWSNTQPHGGLIIVGIDDKGAIVGCKATSQAHRNTLESVGRLCPDARFFSKDVGVKNHKGEDDFVIVFYVSYRNDRLVEVTSGDAWIREGDKRVRILEAMKREIRIARREILYELERVPLEYPNDFDVESITAFCLAFARNRRFTTIKTIEQILELAKLGKNDKGVFQPNLASALMFANDPRDVVPGARIRVIRYEGTKELFGTENNSVFSQYVDGNVRTLLAEAKTVIASQLKTYQRYTSAGRLAIRHEYPEEAWFEAVVNAVAHRSYNFKHQNIFVKIFDNRLVVESPGGFVAPTTAETIYEAHNSRNTFLMEAMMHLELTFCGFEGTRRMKRAMQQARLPEPRFQQIEALAHQVHVTLENRTLGDSPKVVEQPLVPAAIIDYSILSADETLIVQYLEKASEINITNAALVMARSWPTASKTIAALVAGGIIEPITKKGRKHDSTKTYALRRTRSEPESD